MRPVSAPAKSMEHCWKHIEIPLRRESLVRAQALDPKNLPHDCATRHASSDGTRTGLMRVGGRRGRRLGF